MHVVVVKVLQSKSSCVGLKLPIDYQIHHLQETLENCPPLTEPDLILPVVLHQSPEEMVELTSRLSKDRLQTDLILATGVCSCLKTKKYKYNTQVQTSTPVCSLAN